MLSLSVLMGAHLSILPSQMLARETWRCKTNMLCFRLACLTTSSVGMKDFLAMAPFFAGVISSTAAVLVDHSWLLFLIVFWSCFMFRLQA